MDRVRNELPAALDLSVDDYFLVESPLQTLGAEELDFPVLDYEDIHWFDVGLWDDLWTPQYPRGDLPLYVRIAEWLERRIPGSEIWYGSDCDDGESLAVFSVNQRTQMMTLYDAYQAGLAGEPLPSLSNDSVEEQRQLVQLHDKGMLDRSKPVPRSFPKTSN